VSLARCNPRSFSVVFQVATDTRSRIQETCAISGPYAQICRVIRVERRAAGLISPSNETLAR
jgi:hypothetical protein